MDYSSQSIPRLFIENICKENYGEYFFLPEQLPLYSHRRQNDMREVCQVSWGEKIDRL